MAIKKKVTKKRGKRKTAAEKVKDMWIKGIAVSVEDSRSYSMKNKYEIGEVIDHKSFGRGVVQTIMSNEKIEVVFEDQVKILIHNK